MIAADASGSLDVLGNWLDPDGDTLYLVSAQGEGFDVRTTNEGTVTVRDMTGAVGTRTLTVVVSDGQQAASGTVTVDVQSADSVAPIANPDHVLVVAGTSTVVSPLDNDVSPTGDPLSLAGVEETPAGTNLEVNQQAGTFTFSAEQAGTYYVTYDVTAGSAVAQGIVRADVVEPSEPDVPRSRRTTPCCCGREAPPRLRR
ncbi:Ig-like domain-containing protein [Actinomyces sp. Z16]|uniref:Ig-like domain-containing protein n=1 Tax=Actinomyces sp. Z16 TaxID=2079536 RepID=UPI001F303288|nr:Ig-like domain-containing protein [Actinomyces sp. Z16]